MRTSNLVACVDTTCCDSSTIAINSKRALLHVLVQGTAQSKHTTVLYYTRLKNKNNVTKSKKVKFDRKVLN